MELRIFAKPNARKTAVIALVDNILHLSIHAKPHQGEANKEMIAYLAKFFKIPKTRITLIGGETGRHKKISLPATDRVLDFLNHPIEFIKGEGCG